jgi:hypothetical protein
MSDETPVPNDIWWDIMSLVSCVSIVHWRKDVAYADKERLIAAHRVEEWLKTLPHSRQAPLSKGE